ncbi:MAG: hypothetical protein OEZ51_03400 [Nitrospinota bacterium]|nr:hypothetical protein [Nitrospinota bacterium]
MDKPKKEPIALHRHQEQKLCLNCGFPNRPSDTYCMYCKASVAEEKGLGAWLRHTYYVLRWRWQLKQKRENLVQQPRQKAIRFVGYFMIGLILSLAGAYFAFTSVTQNSVTNALIAALLLLYGIFTLKSLFSGK